MLRTSSSHAVITSTYSKEITFPMVNHMTANPFNYDISTVPNKETSLAGQGIPLLALSHQHAPQKLSTPTDSVFLSSCSSTVKIIIFYQILHLSYFSISFRFFP